MRQNGVVGNPGRAERPDSGSALSDPVTLHAATFMICQDMPPRISSTTSGIDANSRLSWSAQGIYLLVEDTPKVCNAG